MVQTPIHRELTDDQREQGRPIAVVWMATWGVYALLYTVVIAATCYAGLNVSKALLFAVFTIPVVRRFTDLLFMRRLATIAQEQRPSIAKWCLWNIPLVIGVALLLWSV